ncbi:phosphatase PAP2 family protein [Gimesia fumaroli]|nr:hypothetical protein [Gimesia fumaroli]
MSALLLLTGCVTTTKLTRIESSSLSDTLLTNTNSREQPGYQRVTESTEVANPTNMDDTEWGTAKSVGTGSSYPDWLNMPPDGIHYRPLHHPDVILPDQFVQNDAQPALVTVEGFLLNDPLDNPDFYNPTFDDGKLIERLNLWDRIKSDHTNYYSRESLTWLAGGFGVGAIMANTSIDEGIQNHFQISVHSASSDDWLETLHAQKEWGNGRYTLPIFAAAWVAGKLFERVPLASTTGEWGERSIRAFLVGTPPMLAMQYVTGASRPGETSSGSRWKPFQDNNGVSGHSFMGAIPFLAAAKMTKKPLLKLAFYAGSTLAPLSRVNDNHHYSSQAFLGWWMAWIATNAVDATQKADRNWTVFPISYPGASGIAVEFRW